MKRHRDKLAWSRTGESKDPSPQDTLTGTVDNNRHPTLLTATGTCPYCLGPMTATKELSVRVGGGELIGQAAAASYVIERVIECGCPHRHPHRPDSRTGCGRSVLVATTIQP